MGVYIKGMNMPKNCGYCRFCFEEDVMFETEFKCDLTGKFINGDYEGNFPDDCPLVEVPEPHGRLIDADALADDLDYDANHFEEEHEMKSNCASWLRSNDNITMIEAEGE